MNRPLVSIICPFYNAERFLAEAIESVLGQDYRDFELLLVDDGSVDRSAGIALDHADRDPGRVIYLQHDRHANRGAAASRNLGLEASNAPFVAFIDSDDVWRPGKLSAQLAILERHPEVGMVCGAVNYWRSWEGGADRVLASGEPVGGISRPPATALRLYPLGTAIAPCPSDLLVRRSVLDEVGGFDPDFVGALELYEDQTFLEKVYLTTPVYFAPNVWLDYRLHDESCVARMTRDGLEPENRRYFLNWFARYLAAKDFAGRERVIAAVARAHWELDHPLLGSLFRRGRSLYRRLVTRLNGLSRPALPSAG
jgi:glycosyltransferase involved in cell wall biosynthesis